MCLLVVCHGVTLLNLQERYSGQRDVPLSLLGELQAEILGLRLAAEPLAAIVSSDLQRARATAQAIALHHGLPVMEDPDLREIAFGEWEGATPAEVEMRDPALDQRWKVDPLLVASPGEETVVQLHARVVRALERWFERYPLPSSVPWGAPLEEAITWTMPDGQKFKIVVYEERERP